MVFTEYNDIDTTEKNNIDVYQRGDYKIALLRTKYRQPYKYINFTPIKYTKDIYLNGSHIFHFEEVVQNNVAYICSKQDTFAVIDEKGNSHEKNFEYAPAQIILSNSQNDTFQFHRTYYTEDKFKNTPKPSLGEQFTIGPIKELLK